jgi:hypothetical protein
MVNLPAGESRQRGGSFRYYFVREDKGPYWSATFPVSLVSAAEWAT